jgi:hypothetical protein
MARNLSAEELALARSFGAPRALGVALRAAGLVAGGQRGQGLLSEAIEVLVHPRVNNSDVLCYRHATCSVEAETR